MGILLFIVFGFIVGLLARAIMPGTQKMGFVATTLLGIAGSFVGGFLVALITSSRVTDLNTSQSPVRYATDTGRANAH